MRNKLLLTILLTLFFTPLVFAEPIKSGASKAVEIEEKVEQIDQKLEKTNTEFNNSLQKLEEDILNKVNEKFNIREENLQLKESFCEKELAVLGILVAIFGVLTPLLILLGSVKMAGKHKKELTEIEAMRIKLHSDLEKLYTLRGKQEEKFIELKELENKQKEKFNSLEDEMKKMLKVSKDSVGEMKEILEAAKGGVDEMKKILKAAEDSAKKSAQSQKEAEYSKIISNVNNLKKDKKYNEALAELQKAIDLFPDKEEAFFHRGVISSEMKEYEKSIEAYNEYIELVKKKEGVINKIGLSAAYNNKGNALSKLNKKEYALKMYNEAINLDPSDPAVYGNKANVLLELERKEEALKMYSEAIKLNPNDPQLNNSKGVVLFELGFLTENPEKKQKLYDEAVEFLKRAKSLNRDSVAYNLIEVFLLKKDFDNAFEELKTYISEFKNPFVKKDDYETRWLVSLEDGIKNGSKAAIEMESLLKESIEKGKLLINERDDD